MESDKISKAAEDIILIRNVLDRTGKSMKSFGKIFFVWGILFFLCSIAGFILNINAEKTMQFFNSFPALSYIVPLPITALLAIIYYVLAAKKTPLNSLEKKIMILWVYLIVLNVIVSFIPNTVTIPDYFSQDPNMHLTVTARYITITSSASVFIAALGLYILSLFTCFHQPAKIAAVYFLTGIACLFISPLDNIVKMLAWPCSFLYIGIYLKTNDKGSQSNGYQSNS